MIGGVGDAGERMGIITTKGNRERKKLMDRKASCRDRWPHEVHSEGGSVGVSLTQPLVSQSSLRDDKLYLV